MSTWEERMSARAAARRPAVELDEMAPDDRERVGRTGPATALLRERFLAGHPDLPADCREGIMAAPIEVFRTSTGHPFDQHLAPYDPADYAWTEEAAWAAADCCRECVVARPPGHGGRAVHWGWGLEQVCRFRCGHRHHDDEVWIA